MKTTKAIAFGLAGAAAALIAFACVDPSSRFDDFDKRVPDAAPDTTPDARMLDELPDITGSWLLSAAPVIAPNLVIEFYVEIELAMNQDGTGTMTYTGTALSTAAKGRMRVGSPFTVTDIPVNAAGEFQFTVMGLPLPGDANPISGAPVALDLYYDGVIKGEDSFCGTFVMGSKVVNPPIDLNGSTFNAVRVAKDAQGMDLPTIPATCPADMPDGGLPDAGIDGGLPDAGGPDAASPDAPLPDAM